MKIPNRTGIFLILIIVFTSNLSAQTKSKPEFRGVWIASVDNIDWPLKGMVNPDSQRVEFIRQLDMH